MSTVKTQAPASFTMSCAGPITPVGPAQSPKLPDHCGGDVCDHCDARCGPDDCGPDPYKSDVHGDDTPVLMCPLCRRASAQDI